MLKDFGAFVSVTVCDQDPAPTVRIRDWNRWFGGLVPGVTESDSGLHFADDAEAPLAVARDVDAALEVTAEGRRAATRARAGSFIFLV